MTEYKGYVAAIEFDGSVGRFHGRVVNSGSYPVATFEATDIKGMGIISKSHICNHLVIYYTKLSLLLTPLLLSVEKKLYSPLPCQHRAY